MRIWIAGGGTGGHVYPGLAVVQALRATADPETSPVDVLYVGGDKGIERKLVRRAGLRFVGVPAAGVHGLAPWTAAKNLIKLTRGWAAARCLGRRERPDALFVTGGYASVPVALAAWTLRVPILLYLPDIEPGQAVRFIARLATRIGVTVDDARTHFPDHKVIVSGYPVRRSFHTIELEEARKELGIVSQKPTLLVFGGSRGARTINQAVSENLEELLKIAEVVHISGTLDWPWVADLPKELPEELREIYHPYPYVHEMGNALTVADLAICRAGASSLGELPFFGLPAILVPYPYAWRYQKVNADWLADRGAAIRLDDEKMGTELVPIVRQLLVENRLDKMSESMKALARPNAAQTLAEELLALACQHNARAS